MKKCNWIFIQLSFEALYNNRISDEINVSLCLSGHLQSLLFRIIPVQVRHISRPAAVPASRLFSRINAWLWSVSYTLGAFYWHRTYISRCFHRDLIQNFRYNLSPFPFPDSATTSCLSLAFFYLLDMGRCCCLLESFRSRLLIPLFVFPEIRIAAAEVTLLWLKYYITSAHWHSIISDDFTYSAFNLRLL